MTVPEKTLQLSEQLAEVERVLLARTPEHKVNPSLARIEALTQLLGQPHNAYPVIHIAGTNGKTSTARMVESLLRSFGLKTGLMTSPHLTSMRERICLDGQPVDPQRFVDAYEEIEPYLALIDQQGTDTDEVGQETNSQPLTFFEVITALGFAIFADAPVDVAVVEVGMGGRWDATNIAQGQVAVLAPIDVDHTDYLGGTLEAIAAEKAGVIKPGSTVIIGTQHPTAMKIINTRAAQVDAVVARQTEQHSDAAGQFSVLERTLALGGQMLTLQGLGGVYEQVLLPLHGAHQAANAACALAAVEAFFGASKGRKIVLETVRHGLGHAVSPGRLELVRTDPTVLLDVAHNPAGAQATAAAVAEAFTLSRVVALIGCMADKDVTGILQALEPVVAQVVLTQPASGRAMPATQLASYAQEIFDPERIRVVAHLDEALAQGMQLARDDDGFDGGAGGSFGSGALLVTGSVVTVGQVRQLLGAPPVGQVVGGPPEVQVQMQGEYGQ